ncbi:hypothetical protein MKX01_022755 [Papaver californicum]|nr:hypothetical protein MKX01_022755 [Papaver californicum]
MEWMVKFFYISFRIQDDSEMVTIFSSIGIHHQCNGNEKLYVKDYLMEATHTRSWDAAFFGYFIKNVSGDSRGCLPDDNTATFLLGIIEKFGHILVQHLKEEPIIVAHLHIPKSHLMQKKAAEEEENKVTEDGDEVKYLKMLMRELLRNIMLELEASKPISISSNFVIHTS